MLITKNSDLIKLNFKQVALLILISINISMLSAQDLTLKQKDSAFSRNPSKERIDKIKKSFAKTFKDFVGNDVSLFGSIVLSKQKIMTMALHHLLIIYIIRLTTILLTLAIVVDLE